MFILRSTYPVGIVKATLSQVHFSEDKYCTFTSWIYLAYYLSHVTSLCV